MPEATIDEDGDSAWAEDHVGTTSHTGYRCVVDSEAEPEAMKGPPQLKLRTRISSALTLHSA